MDKIITKDLSFGAICIIEGILLSLIVIIGCLSYCALTDVTNLYVYMRGVMLSLVGLLLIVVMAIVWNIPRRMFK